MGRNLKIFTVPYSVLLSKFGGIEKYRVSTILLLLVSGIGDTLESDTMKRSSAFKEKIA